MRCFCWKLELVILRMIVAIFPDETSPSATVLTIIPRCVLISYFFWTPFLFFSFAFWDLNSWIFCATFHFSSEFLIFATFWMLWMLVAMNKVKHMILHESHVLQMTSLKPLVTQTFFSVSSEMDPILVTLFLDNKSLKNSQKNFWQSKSSTRTKKRRKT